MSEDIDVLLPTKPAARLRIYAWTADDPPTDYVGLIKVGQTTKEDVNGVCPELGCHSGFSVFQPAAAG